MDGTEKVETRTELQLGSRSLDNRGDDGEVEIAGNDIVVVRKGSDVNVWGCVATC